MFRLLWGWLARTVYRPAVAPVIARLALARAKRREARWGSRIVSHRMPWWYRWYARTRRRLRLPRLAPFELLGARSLPPLAGGSTIEASEAGGKWSATTAWKGGVVPGEGDDVVFGAKSGTVKVEAEAKCRSIKVIAGFNKKLEVKAVLKIGTSTSGPENYAIYAEETSAWLNAGTSTIKFVSTSTETQKIAPGTTIGNQLAANVAFEGTATYEITEEVFFGAEVTQVETKHTVKLAATVHCAVWWVDKEATLTFGSHELKVAGTGANRWKAVGTINAETGTLTIEGSEPTLAMGSKIYNVVKIASSLCTPTFLESFTCAELILNNFGIVAKTKKTLVKEGITITITGTLSTAATSAKPITIESTVSGKNWKLVKTSGEILVEYVELKDSHASGGATFRDHPGGVDNGGNEGWTFAAEENHACEGNVEAKSSTVAAPTAKGSPRGAILAMFAGSPLLHGNGAPKASIGCVSTAAGAAHANGAVKSTLAAASILAGAPRSQGAPRGQIQAVAAFIGTVTFHSAAFAGTIAAVGSFAGAPHAKGNAQARLEATVIIGTEPVVIGGQGNHTSKSIVKPEKAVGYEFTADSSAAITALLFELELAEATSVEVAIQQAGAKPGTVLASTSLAPRTGVNIAALSVALTAGTSYWITILALGGEIALLVGHPPRVNFVASEGATKAKTLAAVSWGSVAPEASPWRVWAVEAVHTQLHANGVDRGSVAAVSALLGAPAANPRTVGTIPAVGGAAGNAHANGAPHATLPATSSFTGSPRAKGAAKAQLVVTSVFTGTLGFHSTGLSGTITIVAIPSSAPHANGVAKSSIAAVSIFTATTRANARPQATVVAVSSLAGVSTGKGKAAGQLPGVCSITAAPKANGAVKAQIAATSALHATLSANARPHGTIGALSTSVAGIFANGRPASSVHALSTWTGTIGLPNAISGLLAAVSGWEATLHIQTTEPGRGVASVTIRYHGTAGVDETNTGVASVGETYQGVAEVRQA